MRSRPLFPQTDKLAEAVELYEAGRRWVHESYAGGQGSTHMAHQSAKLVRAVVTQGALRSADAVASWIYTDKERTSYGDKGGHAPDAELWALNAAFREFEDAIFKRAGELLKLEARRRIDEAKQQIAALQQVVGEIEANLPQDPKDP